MRIDVTARFGTGLAARLRRLGLAAAARAGGTAPLRPLPSRSRLAESPEAAALLRGSVAATPADAARGQA